jgi:hypothetical protein
MTQSRPWRLFGGNGSGEAQRQAPESGSVSVSLPPVLKAGKTGRRFDDTVTSPAVAFAELPEPVIVIDPIGRLVAANEAALDLGRRVGVLLDEGRNGKAAVEALLAKICLANGGGARPWTPVADANWLGGLADLAAARPGEAIFELKSTIRKGFDGDPDVIVVRLIDITPLAETLRGKREAEGHRDRFLKLLSHDLRSPLAAILATLKHPELAAAPAALREIIETASSEALSMIDTTVRLTRAQCADYRFAELDFCHVVEEAIDSCWSAAKSAGVRIVLDPCDEPFPICADRGHLAEALNELFGALIAREARGRVLTCAMADAELNGNPAARLEIRGITYAGPAADAADAAIAASDVFEHNGGLELFKTILSRHNGVGAVVFEPGSRPIMTVTIPNMGTGRDIN